MSMEISKEWCFRMAELEGDASIAAGALAFDPIMEGAPRRAEQVRRERHYDDLYAPWWKRLWKWITR